MDSHRSPEALTGATLEREIEALIAVKPSPDFVARVRMQLADEPARSFWPRPVWMYSVIGVVVASLAVLFVSRSAKTNLASPAEPQIASNPADTPVPSMPRRLVAAPESPSRQFERASRERAIRPDSVHSERRVLIAPDEAAALHRLLARIGMARIDPSTFEETRPADVALKEPPELVIAPLSIDPLVLAGAGEGEAQ